MDYGQFCEFQIIFVRKDDRSYKMVHKDHIRWFTFAFAPLRTLSTQFGNYAILHHLRTVVEVLDWADEIVWVDCPLEMSKSCCCESSEKRRRERGDIICHSVVTRVRQLTRHSYFCRLLYPSFFVGTEFSAWDTIEVRRAIHNMMLTEASYP